MTQLMELKYAFSCHTASYDKSKTNNNRMKIISSLFTLLLICSQTFAQEYGSPVEVPIALSANFAELRPNHLHSGVDIKMAAYPVSKRGVFSTADGYVARVYVNPYGFGKAIYIYHPATKTTSVYGHLDSFSDEIANYVHAEQLRNKSFAINAFLKPTDIKVKKGDKIGVAGNSGISGGIHLHYELRNEKEEPINLIKKGLIKATDNIPPAIISVSVVEIDTVEGAPIYTFKARYPATKQGDGKYTIANKVCIEKPSYITIEYVDRKNGVQNSFGIYSIEAFLNDTSYFKLFIDNINFSTTRYANSFSEYYKNRSSAYSVARLYLSPNNKLKIYDKVKDRGVLNPQKMGKDNKMAVKLIDDSNNTSTVNFTLSTKECSSVKKPYNFNSNSYVIKWDKSMVLKHQDAELSIPLGAFYDDDIVDFYTAEGKSPYSKNVCLKNVAIPTQKAMTLKVKEVNLPENLRPKALLARLNSAGNRISIGGEWKDGFVTAKISDSGVYVISTDTTPPFITAKQEQGGTISGSKIRFTVGDNLSGIATINGYVDGKWAVFALDGKSALLEHELQKEDATKKRHDIKIDITDNKGNKRVYQTHYYW